MAKYLAASDPVPVGCVTFSSAEAFTLATYNAAKNWDGALYYSTDTTTWSEWDGVTAIASAEHSGKQRIYIRGVGNSVITGVASNENRWVLTGSSIRCDGNIENLLDYEMVASGEHPTMGERCYRGLFSNCTELLTAPELPATNLSYDCYNNMFFNCPSLKTAPELPATTLAQACYSYMFKRCTGLTSPPELPATNLAGHCYYSMFSDCTGLTTLPALPATNLVMLCYGFMFAYCTGIKLSATQTDEYQTEYRIPISGTGIDETTSLKALYKMFSNTGGTFTDTPVVNTTYYTSNTIIETQPDNPDVPVGGGCLTFSSAEPFTIAIKNATKNWDGTLYYSTDTATWNEWDGTTAIASAEHGGDQRIYMRGSWNSVITNGLGNGFVVTGSEISCTGNIENLLDYETVANGKHPVMANKCYAGMFEGCTALTTAPELPATALADYCYYRMFRGCTSLTTAPELPATALASNCYVAMFIHCTSLTTVPELPATTLATNCYAGMFRDCTALTTVPELPATTLVDACYYSMFYGCTNIKLSTTKSDEYPNEYRIPASGTGTTATNALQVMFTNTGGTFTGTPEINTTYYMAVSEPEEPEVPDEPDPPDPGDLDTSGGIIKGLITDRTSRNVVRRNELAAKGWARMTDEERAEWLGDPLSATGVNLLPWGAYYSSAVELTYKNAEFRATATAGGTYLYAVLIIGDAENYENKQFTLSVDDMKKTAGSPQLALYWHDGNGFEYAGATLTGKGSVTVDLSTWPNTNGRASLALYVYVTTEEEVAAGAYTRFVGVMFENGATRHEYVPYSEVVPTLATKGAYNYSDLNRVERAVKEISDVRGLGLTTKTDWAMWDIPRKSDMKRYLNNVKIIALVIGSDIELPDSMDKLTYVTANNIEKVLYEGSKYTNS